MSLPVLLLLALVGGVLAHDRLCVVQRTTSLKFGVSSARNETGHRLVKATLVYDSQDSNLVILSVDHWTGLCGDNETVKMDLDVTVPPYGLRQTPAERLAPALRVTAGTTLDPANATAPTIPRPELPAATVSKPPSATPASSESPTPAPNLPGIETREPASNTTVATIPRSELPAATIVKPPSATPSSSESPTPSPNLPDTETREPTSNTTVATIPRSELPAATTAKPPSRTAPGFTVMAGVGAYKPFNLLVKWDEARAACVGEDALLAVPDTQAEADVLLQLVTTAGFKWAAWMGIRSTAGVWKNVVGEPLTSSGFNKWAKGEPNGDGECVELWGTGLNDLACDWVRPFVCEKPQP